MVLTRIGTLGQNTALTTNSLRQQDRLFEMQRQVSSGYVSHDYKGIASDVLTLNANKSLKSAKTQYSQNIKFIELRTERYRFAMDSVTASIDTLRTQILNSMSAYDASELMASVKSNYSLVSQLVNTEENGQRVFGGSRTDVDPWNENFVYPDGFKKVVGDLGDAGDTVTGITSQQTGSASPVYTITMSDSLITANDEGAVAQFDFNGTLVTGQIMSVDTLNAGNTATQIKFSYTDPELGDQGIAGGTSITGGQIFDRVDDIITDNLRSNGALKTLNIDDGVELEYGVPAEPLMRDMFRAVGRLVQYDSLSDFASTDPLRNSQRNFMSSQLDDLVSGISSVSGEQTKNGLNQNILEDTETRHDDELVYIEQVISEIQDVDMAQAVSDMQLAELSLQASFSTLSRVGNTTLLNYI